ncbi:hypothetical protein [Niabella aurantiaca]|uniref:hypothetical protein n=1 Tax=Niabella aurantiaca TaxID=379900 RepID=UPI00036875AA|nr:hypothetical protein [Niabella aurantiaca]
MKKYNIILKTITISIFVFSASCGSKDNDVQKVIDKYCELNTKEHNAAGGAEKEAASAEKKAYEKEVDSKYFKDNKTYQLIMDGMKKCDEAPSNSMETATPAKAAAGESDLPAMLPLAYSDAATVAKTYCALTDQVIAAAKNGTDDELKTIVAAKTMFEHNMEDSYQNNAERRDSIFNLIKPCMEKEVRFKHSNQ